MERATITPQPEGRRPPTLTPDELTLHMIASGLIMLVQRTANGLPMSYPYPAALQRGLDRLALACLRRGVPQPLGIPDLLGWARCPLAEWPLQLPEESIGLSDRLLDGEAPTNVCDAWACTNPDVEAELSERQLIFSAFETCRATGTHATYVAFRSLLISQPVLTALEVQLQCIEPLLVPLAEQIRAAYQPAPVAWAIHGEYAICPHCDNLLQPTIEGAWRCENERCRRKPQHRVPRRISMHEDILWLKRGLRRFVASPGRAELRLAERLRTLGLDTELWPAFDRYDLRITFPDGEIWAIDVKDWANPFMLARQIETFPSEPSWSRAYYVFPDERIVDRGDYVRAFRNACSQLNDHVRAIAERDLVKAVRTHLKGVSGA